jgi:hypothetical protein
VVPPVTVMEVLDEPEKEEIKEKLSTVWAENESA